MSDIDEILSKMNPKVAASFRRASEIKTERLVTPSLGINMAIGGLGYGQIHTIWGSKSSGKSLFCLGLAAQAQKEGKSVAWFDAEKNFDAKWARKNGVDPERLIISRVASIAAMSKGANELVAAGIDLLIVDSMSVLLPQSYFDDGEMKNLENTGQIGTFAKNYGQAVNMLNNLNEKTCIVFISQVRNKIHSHGASKSLMGGEAAEFMNSTIIKLWAAPNIKDDIQGEITNGNLILKRPIGRKVTWTIDKSRGPGMHFSDDYNMYFAGAEVGIDITGEVVTYGIEHGIIEKSGNWLKYQDMNKVNGEGNFTKYLKENPEVQEDIYQKILENTKSV